MPPLPPLSPPEFEARLRGAAPGVELSPATLHALAVHYDELRRWAPRTSLIGPREAATLFARHYGESLAALSLLPAGPAVLLDLGSGAGFPGLILAAVRPDLRVTLVEPRARRWAFLSAVIRKAALSSRCLDARVAPNSFPELAEPVDVVTLRALRLQREGFEVLRSALSPGAALLFWSGRAEPDVPAWLRPARRVELPGSEARQIREYRVEPPLPPP